MLMIGGFRNYCTPVSPQNLRTLITQFWIKQLKIGEKVPSPSTHSSLTRALMRHCMAATAGFHRLLSLLVNWNNGIFWVQTDSMMHWTPAAATEHRPIGAMSRRLRREKIGEKVMMFIISGLRCCGSLPPPHAWSGANGAICALGVFFRSSILFLRQNWTLSPWNVVFWECSKGRLGSKWNNGEFGFQDPNTIDTEI